MNNNNFPLYPLDNVDEKLNNSQTQQNTYVQNTSSNSSNQQNNSNNQNNNQSPFDISNLFGMLNSNNQDMLGMLTKLMGINGSADILNSFASLMNKKNPTQEKSKTKTKHYIKADEYEFVDD